MRSLNQLFGETKIWPSMFFVHPIFYEMKTFLLLFLPNSLDMMGDVSFPLSLYVSNSFDSFHVSRAWALFGL